MSIVNRVNISNSLNSVSVNGVLEVYCYSDAGVLPIHFGLQCALHITWDMTWDANGCTVFKAEGKLAFRHTLYQLKAAEEDESISSHVRMYAKHPKNYYSCIVFRPF